MGNQGAPPPPTHTSPWGPLFYMESLTKSKMQICLGDSHGTSAPMTTRRSQYLLTLILNREPPSPDPAEVENSVKPEMNLVCVCVGGGALPVSNEPT